MEGFRETIKNLRGEKGLPLRKVAAYLDIDQAVLSKFEHGTRRPNRDQVIQLADFFNADKDDLLIKWLAEKVIYELDDDELGLQAMKAAEAQLIYKTKSKLKNK